MKRASDKISSQQLFEYVRGLDIGLTCGYIGNFEKWGDNRSLRIWAGSDVLWDCEASVFTRADNSRAMHLIKAYSLGYNRSKQHDSV